LFEAISLPISLPSHPVARMKLLILFASSVAGASVECLAGDAACNVVEVDDSALLNLRASVKRPQNMSEEAALASATAENEESVCSGASKDNPCWKYESKAFIIEKGVDAPCGSMLFSVCDAASWVFCQNAKCSEELKQDLETGRWYSECACWEQTSDNGKADQNVSIIPAASGAGGNCVMGNQPGGKEMCDQMKAGKLWSTYGPKGSFLPGLPLAAASCEPHTPWVWCWGAPCERNEAGDVVCKCPLMINVNDKPQVLGLPGDSLCTEDPCSGHMFNSQPAGPTAAAMPDPCYDYKNASTVTDNAVVIDNEGGTDNVDMGNVPAGATVW